MVFRQLKQEEPRKIASKPYNDTLMTQVNSLRHELQLLASNGPITIVTIAGSGSRKFGLIIIIGVISYGYVWWKSWKLPDLMFATRRRLSDACNSVDNQIDGFYSSLSGTKRELSSEIDRMARCLDANTEIIQKTGGEVTELCDGTAIMKDEVRSVFDAVETLTLSLPLVSPCESQSPSTPYGAQQSHGPLQHTQSMSGLKDLAESSGSRETFSSETYSGENSASGSSSGMLGRFSIPKIVRSRTAVNTMPTN